MARHFIGITDFKPDSLLPDAMTTGTSTTATCPVEVAILDGTLLNSQQLEQALEAIYFAFIDGRLTNVLPAGV